MKRVQFIFGIHNHQPVGNFDDVFNQACDNAYLPFLQVLEKFPDISIALHFSGSLIEWLEKHRPEILELFFTLVKRGNIEVLGAGYYEPVLAMISETDQIGQITKMNAWAQKRMGYNIEGSWLTERVWEPHLTRPLAKAGIRYIVVDDYHFLTSGVKKGSLDGYFHTEQEGHVLGVFPISQKLRYAIPFEDPEITIDILKEYATEEGDRVVVMADDGEKFGVWPGTHQTVYDNKWLERFFTLLQENSSWLKTTTFKDYYQKHDSNGLVYLPTISYFEMSQWTLATELGQQMDKLIHDLEKMGKGEEARPFVKGGMWRNFLSKYEESNWMQKRVQNLSDRMLTYEKEHAVRISDIIRDDLYRAQCNCAYWHGVFGGLYLPHLRHAIYVHLLKAEIALNKLEKKEVSVRDIDVDDFNEYTLRNKELQIIVSEDGGQIREMDWLPGLFNITNFIQRYPESYHVKLSQADTSRDVTSSIHDIVLAKEEGLQDKLYIDSYRRRNLIDHVFSGSGSLEDYAQGKADNLFVRTESKSVVKTDGQNIIIQTPGKIGDQPCSISKSLHLEKDTLRIQIELVNKSSAIIAGRYGCEFNFGLLGGDTPDRYYRIDGTSSGHLNTKGEHSGVSSIEMVNEWDGFAVQLRSDSAFDLWRAPIETISMSEAGFERVYQASSILMHWNINLDPGHVFRTGFALTVCRIDPT